MSEQSFDLTATKAFAAITLRRVFFGPVGWIACGVFLSPFAILLWKTGDRNPLGIALLLLTSLLLLTQTFIRAKLENDDEAPFSESNLAGVLSPALVREFAWEKEPDVHVLLEAALKTDRAAFMLREMGIDRATALEALRRSLSRETPRGSGQAPITDLDTWIRDALPELAARKEKKIGGSMVLTLFLKNDPAMQELLHRCDLSETDLERIAYWEMLHFRQARDWFLSSRSLLRNFGGIGRSWVMGYTRNLDRLTSDLSESILWKRGRVVILRTEAIENMRRIVRRSTQNNILVTGKAGVGKRTLIENFTRDLRRAERKAGSAYTRVLILQTQTLLSGVAQPDAFLLSALEQARKAGKFILIVPDVGMLLSAANANVKCVLLEFLQTSGISMIALADTQDYHSLIKPDPAMDNLFEKIPLEDASDDDTMTVLMEQYFGLERKGIRITYKALQSIVELSRRYVGKGAFPGRAMHVMEDAILLALQHGDRTVREAHIRDVVSLKANMNVREVSGGEKDKLLHLESTLRTKIIGQEKPLHGLVNALKRARMDVGVRKRPLGTFLFLGPTGVGKTETAKVLADAYFGSVDRIVRLDMNEYSTENSIEEIIGSSEPGVRHAEGYLTKKIQDQPFSLVLLDEIEKAHPRVLNLFLQILDEGQLTDGIGVRTNFRNTIIIATSNAGGLFIRDFFKERGDSAESRSGFKQELVDAILKQKLFSPEFLNRFDDVLVYYPLTEQEAEKLTILMLDNLIRDFDRKRGVKILVDEDVVAALAKKGYSVEFGAREMRRVITNVVETYLADYILTTGVKRGETITLKREDLQL